MLQGGHVVQFVHYIYIYISIKTPTLYTMVIENRCQQLSSAATSELSTRIICNLADEHNYVYVYFGKHLYQMYYMFLISANVYTSCLILANNMKWIQTEMS